MKGNTLNSSISIHTPNLLYSVYFGCMDPSTVRMTELRDYPLDTVLCRWLTGCYIYSGCDRGRRTWTEYNEGTEWTRTKDKILRTYSLKFWTNPKIN